MDHVTRHNQADLPTPIDVCAYVDSITAGKASDYICHARDEIKPGDRVVLRCRVSSCVQAHKKNLDDSEAHLRKRAEQLGAIVVYVYQHVGSGWDTSSLDTAAEKARLYGAKIFAESTDRLIRNPLYSKYRQDLQAQETDLQKLQRCTEGIVLVTDIHPDASPSEVRSYQRKRGQAAKGNRGGRPTKQLRRSWKARRLARIKLSKEMRAAGLSYREIAKQLNDSCDGFSDVTGMTIYNWLK